jgi:hypothetical protein
MPRTAAPVPYFWSDQYGLRIQSLGTLTGAAEIQCVHGQWHTHEFVALYRKGNELVGAFGLNAARHLMPWRAKIEARLSWAEATAASH